MVPLHFKDGNTEPGCVQSDEGHRLEPTPKNLRYGGFLKWGYPQIIRTSSYGMPWRVFFMVLIPPDHPYFGIEAHCDLGIHDLVTLLVFAARCTEKL